MTFEYFNLTKCFKVWNIYFFMVEGIMSLDKVFSENYSLDKGVLNALDSFAQTYFVINSIEGRRWHNRDVFSFLKQIFSEEEIYDNERIISCYKYYFDKREDILNRENYQGDLI